MKLRFALELLHANLMQISNLLIGGCNNNVLKFKIIFLYLCKICMPIVKVGDLPLLLYFTQFFFQPQLMSDNIFFISSGPSHMSLHLSPRYGVEIIDSSLGELHERAIYHWKENVLRPQYFVYYSHGIYTGPWYFWVEVEVSWQKKELIYQFICYQVAACCQV